MSRILAIVFAIACGLSVWFFHPGMDAFRNLSEPYSYVRDGLLVLGAIILFGSFIGSVAMGLGFRWRRENAHRETVALMGAQERLTKH